MPDDLRIETFPLGDWMTNCYVAVDPAPGGEGGGGGGRCWVVDAGFEPEAMLAYVAEHNLRVEKIVLTHAHLDHIGGLWDVHRAHPDAPILIHEAERDFLTDTTLNLSAFAGIPVVAPEAHATVAHGDRLTLGRHDFEVRHTPGHSPGGITLYNARHRVALVGDALFEGSIGRHDFPTSDGPLLLRSIREQLLTLPDDVRVYPGHGSSSTIGAERRSNPYLRD